MPLLLLAIETPFSHVLQRYLPPSGLILEIASGSGEHVAHFARAG